MTKQFLHFAFLFLFAVRAISQSTTVTFTTNADGGGEVDSWVHSLPADTNTSFSSDGRMVAFRWTSGGVPFTTRAYFRFDLSSIPSTAHICSAVLTAYTTPDNDQSGYNQPNYGYLKKVTSAWTYTTVTWHNQPTHSSTDTIPFGTVTTSSATPYTINVTSQVQEMVSSPSTNYGWLMMLRNETNYYDALSFASSNNTTIAHPYLTVTYAPTITGTTPAARCSTGTVTLGATTNAGTINWYAAATGGSSLGTGTSYTTPSLSVTTTYYVDATYSSCTTPSRTSIVATVNSLPTLTVSSSPTICVGSAATLTVSGASTYIWSPSTGLSTTTGTTTSASPTVTTTYTVTGTNSNGCVNTKTILVNVNPLPTLTVSSAPTICAGTATTLTVSGASTYTWSPSTGLSTTTGTTTSASPTVTTTYTVTGTNSNGCVNTKTIIVTVTPLPTVTVNSDTIYGSLSGTLTAHGATTYSWTPSTSLSATTGSVVVASPSVTTIYTVTGTASSCSSSATAIVTNMNLYFRSEATGNWNNIATWQSSVDNSTWTSATVPPDYRAHTITIQASHTVTVVASVTVDETVINGEMIYNNTSGSTISINDGTGIDLTVYGTFSDAGPNDINWLASSSWTIGSSGTLIRSMATSSDKWKNYYDGGISTIPASSNWIVRKTGTANPSISTNGMYYGNLNIENNTGTTWTTSTASSFTGTAGYPTIQGNMSIGGNGTGNVSFLDTNTNAQAMIVQGNFTVTTGSTFRNHGTGCQVQGNLVLNGTVNYSSSSMFLLAGSNNQTISGTSITINNLNINKTLAASTVTLNSPVSISGTLTFSVGVMITDTVHLLTFNAGSSASGVNNDSSFVSGPVKKIGNTIFTFPLGKHTNAQTIAITAPTSSTDAFQAEYFDTNPTSIYGVYTDTTFNYISTCEYFILKRKNGTSNIQPTLSYDPTACISNLLPAPRVIGYNGTKWKDLGLSNLTYSSSGGTVSTDSIITITQYSAVTLGNYNPLITNTPNGDTCFAAIPMPSGATSTLTGQTQSTGRKWYTFTPTTPEIKITLTNTSMGSNHIHDLILLEGLCYDYINAGYDSSRTDNTLTITLHEALVGSPYFISTFRERTDCYMCGASSANFDLKVQCLPNPVQTVSSGVVSLNGIPSHKAEQVIIRVNKNHLNLTNVNNTSMLGGIASQFFDTDITGAIAQLLYNSDTAIANNLNVTKVYPYLTSNDTITLSIDSQSVQIPAFYENFVLSLPKNTKLFNTSRQLTALQWVKYAHPNYVALPASVPNDFYYSTQQGSLHPITYPDGSIQAEGAWDIETGQDFIKIGVYDSGIDGTDYDLSGSKVGGGYDYTTGTPISSGTNNDASGHGTGCAGIIAGLRNNSTGIAGIAGGDGTNTGCTLYDMRMIAPGAALGSSDIAPAITQGVDNYGIRIMNSSWTMPSTAFDPTLHDAVQYVVKKGVIFCASRGNYDASSTGNIDDKKFPACFQDEMVINVGASGTDGTVKTSANGDLSNPSDQLYSSMIGQNVDVLAPGTTALVYTTDDGGGYQQFNGTSAASPHVAGVAGLMLSYLDQTASSPNNLVIEDVEQILQRTAYNYDFPGIYDSANGWGLINATAAMNAIKAGTFKIHHFALGQNVLPTSHLWTADNILGDQAVVVNLTEAYGTLDAGDNVANIWTQNVQLDYTLPANEFIVAAWPRFSGTVGWAKTNPLGIDNWCSIQSVSNTKCILQTHYYDFYADQNNNPDDPTYPDPATINAAVTIYTQIGVAGIDKVNNANNTAMNLYPNPAYNSTTISVALSTPQEVSLEIYDIQGRLVKTVANERASEGSHQYLVSLADMTSGVYYARLITDTFTSEKKLIITK